MRLNFHIEGSGVGGNETILMSLFPALRKRGHQILLTMEHTTCLNVFENCVDQVNVSGDPDVLGYFLNDSKPDHFIGVHGKVFHLARLAKTAGIRTTWMVGHPSSIMGAGELFATIGMTLFDQILFQSEFLKRDLLELVEGATPNPSQLRTILSGIDTNKFVPSNRQQRLATREKLGISPGDTILVSASRWVEYKNLPLLLESFELVQKRCPKTRLLFLAPQHEPAGRHIWKHLWSRVEQQGLQSRVQFLSVSPSEMPDFLSASDVFVSCAKEEGLGCALIEAMSCGLPVVAHESGGIVEVCGDGIGGVLTQQLEGEAFARELIRLVENPKLRREMGALGRKKIIDSFSCERMISEYEAVFCQ